MKQYILLAGILFSLHSCIKVEADLNCSSLVPLPSFSGSSFTIAVGQTLLIANTGDTVGTDFIWEAPDGKTYTMPSLNAFISGADLSGTWSVYASSRIYPCKTDKVYFTVNVTPAVPPCSLTGNYYKVGNNPLNYVQSTAYYAASNYYLTHFYSPGSPFSSLEMTFRQPPVAGKAYRVIYRATVSELQPDECLLSTLLGSTLYFGRSGVVYVSSVSGKLKFVFCSVLISNPGVNFPNSQASVVLD